VLLDVAMPRLPGPDAFTRICQIHSGMPVIFTSGNIDQSGWLEPAVAPNTLLLQKPYSPKILARKVRELLDGIVNQNPTGARSENPGAKQRVCLSLPSTTLVS
jgi:FixJ family two-component response regulator